MTACCKFMIIVGGCLILSGCGASAPETSSKKAREPWASFDIPFGWEILDEQVRDFDGDGEVERLLILGAKNVPESPFDTPKTVVLQDRYGIKKLLLKSEDEQMPYVRCDIGDLTGDGFMEALVITFPMANGGAGVLIPIIIEMAPKQMRRLELAPIGIASECAVPGEEFFVLRASKKRIWQVPFRAGYWDEWVWETHAVEPWLCPSHDIEIVDGDGDKPAELATRHLICGEANADIIGEVRVVFRWNGTVLAPADFQVFSDGGAEVSPE